MHYQEITIARIVQSKNRLRAAGLLNKQDAALFDLCIKCAEENKTHLLTAFNMLDMVYLVDFSESYYKEVSEAKKNPKANKGVRYKNNKRILD